MQDDTWINQNMDALYLNMIRYPALIHANSPPTLYLDQARRRFYNSGMDTLDTAFSKEIQLMNNCFASGFNAFRLC